MKGCGIRPNTNTCLSSKNTQVLFRPTSACTVICRLVMQQWNIYRSRAMGHWLQENGLPVITKCATGATIGHTNCACTGAPAHSTIAIGSHGCIKLLQERKYFIQGLDYVVNRLSPKTIIVYGTAPDAIFSKYKEAGITILQFISDYMIAHKKAVNA